MTVHAQPAILRIWQKAHECRHIQHPLTTIRMQTSQIYTLAYPLPGQDHLKWEQQFQGECYLVFVHLCEWHTLQTIAEARGFHYRQPPHHHVLIPWKHDTLDPADTGVHNGRDLSNMDRNPYESPLSGWNMGGSSKIHNHLHRTPITIGTLQHILSSGKALCCYNLSLENRSCSSPYPCQILSKQTTRGIHVNLYTVYDMWCPKWYLKWLIKCHRVQHVFSYAVMLNRCGKRTC